jgi:bifunctional NMN adenylyltransferase/nudix hydrolase
MKNSVGVVIGRFQCHRLTEGHEALLDKADEHSKLLICIGVSGVVGTPHDPLDYQAREQMLKEEYPCSVIVPLPDNPTNEGWTKQINQLLNIMFPTDDVVIYCGRVDSGKSLQSGYHGPHKVHEIDEIPNVSATNLRASISRSVEASEAFRRGVIYGATNQFTRCDPVVDICVWKPTDNGVEILLGRRHNEGGKLRLPGGHINASDKTAEDAAKRELHEETGVEAGEFEILDQIRVVERDAAGYAMFTTLFLAKYLHGAGVGGDDLDDCVWVNKSQLAQYLYADSHRRLLDIAIEAIGRKQCDRSSST